MKSKKIIIGIVLILSAIFMSAIGTNKAIAGDSFFSDLSEEKKYDWIVRARLMGIFPSGDSTALNPVSTALGGPAELSAKDWYIPELDITYMVTKHIGVELILGVSQHDISSKGTLAPLAPGVVADTWLLPPTLLLQYHFNPDGKFRPYVGVGLNVTFAFGEDVKPVLTTGTGLTSVDIDTSVGIALQAGFDYEINEKWFFNVDAKWIHMEPDVTLRGGALGTQKLEAEINPFVIGVGLGMRF